jgi:hypothetical protein
MKKCIAGYVQKAYIIVVISILLVNYGYGKIVPQPFLLIDPSAVTLGMGSAGVAYVSEEAFSIFHNPSLSAFSKFKNNVNLGFYPNAIHLMPDFRNDLNLYNFSLYGNYKLTKDSTEYAATLGLGYFYQGMDLGNLMKVNEEGEIIETLPCYESSHNLNISFSFDYLMKFGVGMNFKYIFSHIPNYAKSPAFDIGLLVQTHNLEFNYYLNKIKWITNAAAGFSMKNYGDTLDYGMGGNIDYGYALLSRASSFGYSINSSLHGNFFDEEFNIIELTWSANTGTLLINNGYEYIPFFSGVKFFDNMVFLRGDSSVFVYYGMKLTILDFLTYSFGRKNDYGFSAKTFGYGLNFNGLLKMFVTKDSGPFLNFLKDKTVIQFNFAKNLNKSDESWGVVQIGLKNMW